jgi:hypothetical protein
MGVRNWFWRLLDRGKPAERDLDELVELANLPLFDATLLTEMSRSYGLEASCIEAYSIVARSLSNGRVFVRRHGLADAQRIWQSASV